MKGVQLFLRSEPPYSGVNRMPQLLMPKIGLTMTEGLLSQWHVSVGDSYKVGDLLFTVETEKVANEVEAEVDGQVLEILVPEGDTVPVGEIIAHITSDGAETAIPAESGKSTGKKLENTPQDGPSARKLMAEHSIDRDDVVASGRGGRVLKEDVLRIIATPLAKRIAKNEGVKLSDVSGSGPRGRIKADDVRKASTNISVVSANETRAATQEFTPDSIRLATARRVTIAKRDIPHFYVTDEAEITALLKLRKELNADENRPRISITHMLIKALGLALAEMPAMNRIWAGEKIIAFESVDIGMVTETPEGLRVPVLRNVSTETLDSIAGAAAKIAARAKEGTLSSADVGDSILSISNVGMFGVASLTPIINPPNAMILGVGSDRRLFRPDEQGQPELKCELTLTLACDHRIIDGADAARFLSLVTEILETPVLLLRPERRTARHYRSN